MVGTIILHNCTSSIFFCTCFPVIEKLLVGTRCAHLGCSKIQLTVRIKSILKIYLIFLIRTVNCIFEWLECACPSTMWNPICKKSIRMSYSREYPRVMPEITGFFNFRNRGVHDFEGCDSCHPFFPNLFLWVKMFFPPPKSHLVQGLICL